MTIENSTVSKALPSIEQLPENFAITLNNFGAISLKGEDQSSYLQGQVTCDVSAATENSLMHGAHCDAKGKTFSIFRLINRLNSHLLLQPQESISASLAELKKFGVFAKVEIQQEDTLSFCALVGEQAKQFIQTKYNVIPDSLTPVLEVDNTTIVYIAGNIKHYILIDSADVIESLLAEFAQPVFDQSVWQLIEIKEGFPILAGNSISAYVPQMVNLQAIHGISFTKGCYLGQETVARMQYLGKNKRALYTLQGNISNTADIALSAGDIVELQLGDNWRKAGDILASYLADDGSLYIQAVLASDTDENTILRVKGIEDSILNVVPLPYSLTS